MADYTPAASLPTAAAEGTDAAEGPSLNWWQQRQLQVLASAENSGVVLLLGGAEGSTALRCSVLLPLLLLQHGWAPQPTHHSWQQQHILVALETSSSAESAAAAAKVEGGGCYASCVTTHKSIIGSSSGINKTCSSPPRLVYLTTRQLLQRLLQQPLLQGCCMVAVEVSLQHSFSTELLLPLLHKVRQKRPALRLLLLLPPAAVQPHWALQLAEFFATGEDSVALGAAVMPQGAVGVLRAAAQQQQELLLRFLTPRGGRWDVKHQQQKQRQQQQVMKQQSSISPGFREPAAATTPPEHAVGGIELLEISSSSSISRSNSSSNSVSCISSDEVMVLGVTVAERDNSQRRISKRKKAIKKGKKKLQQRLRKVRRKLEKISNSSSKKANRGNLLVGEAVCLQTDTLADSSQPAQFLHEASHAVHPEGSSTEEASPVRRAKPSPGLTVRNDEAASSCQQPFELLRNTSSRMTQQFTMSPVAEESFKAFPPSKRLLSAVSILSLALPTHPVAVRYLKTPTPNFIRTAAAVGGHLQQLLLPSKLPLLLLLCQFFEFAPKGDFSASATVNDRLHFLFNHFVQHVQLLELPSLLLCWLCAAVARLVARAAESPSESSSIGSIFVFVPSVEDVEALAGALQQRLQQPIELQQQKQLQECPSPPIEIVCLAPDLTPALPPGSSALRIFISSAVFPPCVSPHALAVKFVVDCLYTRRTVFDSFLRLNRICNVPISGALADLRASLAGRLAEGGCCFRLCTADAFAVGCCRGPPGLASASSTAHVNVYEEFPASTLEDIAPLLLRLKALGTHSQQRLPLLQPPPSAAIAAAAEQLVDLQAVDERGHITKPLGWMMSQGILSPELTRLLLIAADKAFGCSIEAAAICALLSGPPVWQRSALESCGFLAKKANREGNCPRASEARQQLTLSRAMLGAIEGDPLTALNVFNRYVDVRRTEGPAAAARWAQRHAVDERVMARAANMRRAVLQWLQHCQLPCLSCEGDCKPLLRALTSAFCLNVAQRTHRHTYRLYRLPASATAPPFVIHPSSVLANCRPSFVVYGQAFMRNGCVYMQQVTAIEPQWLAEVAGHLYAVKA